LCSEILFTLKNNKMKKNEDLQKAVQCTIKGRPILNAAGNGVNTKFSKQLKKLVYITSLAAMGLFFNGCMAGFVTTEPSYVEYSRPPRPNNLSIWIDGDWGWNSQTHVYVQKAGYWERPRQNQTFVSGHWQTTPRGRTWAKGHWQKRSR
jgi:hypothetical protein